MNADELEEIRTALAGAARLLHGEQYMKWWLGMSLPVRQWVAHELDDPAEVVPL